MSQNKYDNFDKVLPYNPRSDCAGDCEKKKKKIAEAPKTSKTI